MRTQLAGLHVAITGGARGIGLASTVALLESGARVTIGDIDGSALCSAATELDNERLAAFELDIRDRESFREFLEQAEGAFGPLDVLVNNAGIMPIGPLLGESDETARRMFDINVHGTILGTKLALDRMVPRRHGHIVNVASVAGRVAAKGLASYCGSKHAVVGFTESVRMEFADSGVNVSAVLPNFTATELVAGTKQPRFIGNLTPHQVANAILGVIEHPRAEVIVPSFAAPMVLAEPLMPRAVRQVLARIFGTENTFLQPDAAARSTYNQRIG